MNAAYVRVTWPDGTSDTRTYADFCQFQANSAIAQDILDRLEADGFVILINEKHPDQRIRLDLTQSEGLN